MTGRFWSKVNKTDTCWLWTASLNPAGYGQFRLDGKIVRAHRVSYSLLVGEIPKGKQLDHLCYVRHCVNPDHLRPVTPKQNTENKQGLLSSNTSGFLGVHWVAAKEKWRARVTHNGHRQTVGWFDTPEEANIAVREKRLALFTHNEVDKDTLISV